MEDYFFDMDLQNGESWYAFLVRVEIKRAALEVDKRTVYRHFLNKLP